MAKDAAAPMVEEVAIRLADGKDWVVPPLPIDQLVVHLPMLRELADMSPTTPWAVLGADRIDELCEMIAGAMRLYYRDMTKEKLQSLLNLRTFGLAIAAVMNQAPAQSPAPLPQKNGKTDG